MCQFDQSKSMLLGPGGQLQVPDGDDITRKMAMLIEGECGGLGPNKAAEKYGYSRQRYFQLRKIYQSGGASALANKKRGPKTNYRGTHQAVKEVIRHRYLDSRVSAAVVAQKMRQCDYSISVSTVQRIMNYYGLEKKTLHQCIE